MGTYIRLVDIANANDKEAAFLEAAQSAEHSLRFNGVRQERFGKIPGAPVAYWVGEISLKAYTNGVLLKDVASPRAGLATGDNPRFQRLWYEVNIHKIGFNYFDVSQTLNGLHKWFPCNSGGDYRKWATNDEYVVNWHNNGYELKNFINNSGRVASRPQNTQFYFKRGITWNKLSSSRFGVKLKPQGYIFDDTSRSAFMEENDNLLYLSGFLCSVVTFEYLRMLNPTMSFTNGDLERLPFIFCEEYKPYIDELVTQNISISKIDWDSFETSWDFVTHPLIKYKVGFGDDNFENMTYEIADAFGDWRYLSSYRFATLKANEEELNRIFIEIYGLQDELTPEVADKDVTIRKADLTRDIKSFISYAVGCMFGRYSLDVDGLAYAGGDWDSGKYRTFAPDADGIIPITDDDYFDDDIVLRFVEFVRVVFGAETLEANLNFIADALYIDGNMKARDRIRRYFMNDFYKDHVKTYQKKPIYWQFESGRKNGFKCLIYLHRYDRFTLARVRTDYLHNLQRAYSNLIQMYETHTDMAKDPRERAELRKLIEAVAAKQKECRAYDPALAHLAYQQIELDLDDGVTVNYARFQGVEIMNEEATGLVTIDLLSKI